MAAVNIVFEPILLPKGTTVASVLNEEVGRLKLCPTASLEHACGQAITSSSFASRISIKLSEKNKNSLLALLNKHEVLFDSDSVPLGRTSEVTHCIEMDGSFIVRHRPYRVSSAQRKIIQENVDYMLQRDIVRL